MNKIVQLRAELDEAEKKIANTEAFEDTTLTDEEAQLLETRRSENDKKIVVINEEGDGGKTEIPVSDYLDALDKNAMRLKSDNLLLMSRRVEQTAAEIEADARKSMRETIVKNDISDDDLDIAINKAIDAVKSYFNADEMTNDIVNKLAKLPADQVLTILPVEFINSFAETTPNKLKMKEDLLASLAYCVSIGPEMDKLNEDIEHHNKMIDLMMRMNEINIDFADILASPDSIKEMTERLLENRNIFAKDYIKYVKNPDGINNLYTQKAYTLEKMNEAYRKFAEELTDEDEQKEVAKEIASNDAMVTVYKNILNLDTITEAVNGAISTGADKNGSIAMKKLEADSMAALKRFRKLKEAIAVPGYTGKESGAQGVYVNYLKFFRDLFPAYNRVIAAAVANGDTELVTFDCDPDLFAKCLLVTLGRVSKKLSAKNTLEASSEIVITFDMICRLGTELFMLEKLYKALSPMMKIVTK